MEKARLVTVELPEELAQEAETLGLDLARACREGLWMTMRKLQRDRAWKEENREAMEARNRWFEEHGLPLERYRLL